MPTTESSPTRARLPRRGAWHAWTYRTQTPFWPSRLPLFRLTLKPSQVHAPASPQVPILVDHIHAVDLCHIGQDVLVLVVNQRDCLSDSTSHGGPVRPSCGVHPRRRCTT